MTSYRPDFRRVKDCFEYFKYFHFEAKKVSYPDHEALFLRKRFMYHHNVTQDTTAIFSKLSTDEGLRLFKDLANVHGEIICKGEGDEIYRLVVELATGKKELHCSVPSGCSQPKKEINISGNFFIGGERYFFKTPVRIEADIVILRMDAELFHLQRRQNYRIKIPENYPATLQISSYNKGPVKLSGHLVDLSSGGCRVTLTASLPVLEAGSRIDGHIVIRNRDSLEIEGTIRYHKIDKSLSTTQQVLGVEFKPLSSMIEGKLFALTMDLHREFYLRSNTKN